METLISVISDLTILIFNVSLYIRLTALKNNTARTRVILYTGVTLITASYFVAVYGFHVPYAAASFLCMTVPSFLFLLCLSKYKNARFLVTFCFVDTITFIIASIAKVALILGGSFGGAISCLVLIALCIAAFLLIRPYCGRYRELMEQVVPGWTPMAVSTLLIYVMLIFITAYPGPLAQRMEYLPVYLVFCLTILSFYWVFIVLILQKAKLTRANALLKQQQQWHDMAYLDELTKLGNPAAYAARVEKLQKNGSGTCALVVFDIDDFKAVNDSHGHHYGNEVLKHTAEFFLKSFSREQYEFFRIGGDEFAAIVSGVTPRELRNQVEKINTMPLRENPGCTYSCGWASVDLSQKDGFEKAFMEADRAMYQVKTRKKDGELQSEGSVLRDQ